MSPVWAVLARIEPSPHRRLHAEVERWLGSSLSYLDRWDQADAYLWRAKALAEREGDRAKLAVVYSELGLNALRASDAVRATDALTAAWAILQTMEGVLDIKLASATMQASAWRARGMYDRALAVLDAVEGWGRETAFLDMGFVLLERARCRLDLGDVEALDVAGVGIDIPIGLATDRVRAADTLARQVLGPRRIGDGLGVERGGVAQHGGDGDAAPRGHLLAHETADAVGEGGCVGGGEAVGGEGREDVKLHVHVRAELPAMLRQRVGRAFDGEGEDGNARLDRQPEGAVLEGAQLPIA